jgi:hypothetical protein
MFLKKHTSWPSLPLTVMGFFITKSLAVISGDGHNRFLIFFTTQPSLPFFKTWKCVLIAFKIRVYFLWKIKIRCKNHVKSYRKF